jgi:hypothetical protein
MYLTQFFFFFKLSAPVIFSGAIFVVPFFPNTVGRKQHIMSTTLRRYTNNALSFHFNNRYRSILIFIIPNCFADQGFFSGRLI